MNEASLRLLQMEDGYIEEMRNVVEPYLDELRQEGTYDGVDGVPLHYSYYKAMNSKGSIVIIHGFSEFEEKYNEMVYHFVLNHYDVYILELRGHGKSYRMIDDPYKVHIDSFDTYVEDIHLFMGTNLVHEGKQPMYMLGHSMGGCLTALYGEKYPKEFKKLILSSPMVHVRTGRYPSWMVRGVTAISNRRGKSEEYAGGTAPFKAKRNFKNSSCSDLPRYNYTFDLRLSTIRNQTWSPTNAWLHAAVKGDAKLMRNAHRIKASVLVIYAGNDRLVDPSYTHAFISRLKDVRSIFFGQAKHEVFNSDEESRTKYYQSIFEFMEK